MTTVSLIIPNWNGRAHLEVCLRSVAAQSRRPERTIVVDNGSSDGSQAFLAELFPWVELLALPENRGFAVAVNRGIDASDTTLIALLNNDTELDPLWLSELIRELEADPQAGMAACKMLRFEQRTIIDGAGDAWTRGGSPLTLGSGEADGDRFNERRYVPGACAGAALYRRSLFEAIGAFDEDFVSYYEDVDLSLRAQLAGYRCVYVPTAVCYHKRGATSALLKDYPVRMQECNLTAVHLKNLPGGVLLKMAPAFVAGRIRRILRECRAGVAAASLRGVMCGLARIPRLLRKRRAVLRLRAVTTDDLLSLFGL